MLASGPARAGRPLRAGPQSRQPEPKAPCNARREDRPLATETAPRSPKLVSGPVRKAGSRNRRHRATHGARTVRWPRRRHPALRSWCQVRSAKPAAGTEGTVQRTARGPSAGHGDGTPISEAGVRSGPQSPCPDLHSYSAAISKIQTKKNRHLKDGGFITHR